MPKKTTARANSFNTGMASEYFVLSQLFRMGLEAYLSQGNKKSIDIRVVHPSGKTVSIDVKSTQGYSSLIVNNVREKKDHFIVFVIYKNKFEDLDIAPDVFILPSEEVVKITKTFGAERRVMKGAIKDFKDNWKLLEDNP